MLYEEETGWGEVISSRSLSLANWVVVNTWLSFFLIYLIFCLCWVFVAVCGLLIAVASLVAEHGL